jgi:hypothetical protein
MDIDVVIGNDVAAPGFGTVRALGNFHRKGFAASDQGRRCFGRHAAKFTPARASKGLSNPLTWACSDGLDESIGQLDSFCRIGRNAICAPVFGAWVVLLAQEGRTTQDESRLRVFGVSS